MQFMILIKADKNTEAGVCADEKKLAELGKFNEELVKAGIMLACEGLQPSSKGARVKFSGGKRTVIDGPFVETKEMIAGFWLWRVQSKEQAIEWVKRCPNPMGLEIEIRQVFEPDEFALTVAPALRTTETHDEAQIRQLIADEARAICAKDVDRIMAHYAPDVVFFDVKPPFQTRGAAALRRIWETCLPYFPASFEMETRDLRVFVSGDLAVAHWLFRFAGMEKDHPAMQTWLRNTVSYQRKQGRWQIVHAHCSVPFDPESSRAVFTFEP